MNLSMAWATRPASGEVENGDAVVMRSADGFTLFGVVDALGHGPEAHKVARLAWKTLWATPLQDGIEQIFQTLNHALHGTRGAAATLCLQSDDWWEAAAVGNVTLRSAPHQLRVVPCAGILGTRLRALHVWKGTVPVGARVVVFSDGIAPTLDVTEHRKLPPTHAARCILEEHSRHSDDASVVVADAEET